MNCSTVRQATGISKPRPAALQRGEAAAGLCDRPQPAHAGVFRDASLIAPSETRVLITGESGVGKEVVADVIHAWSPRAAGPLIKVNCAAIPETLLEANCSATKKARSPARHAQRIGRFEEATAARFFWMKSPRCRRRCRPSCCA
jgi:transcriptional regulator with GAF, ATPase, and Fis domain